MKKDETEERLKFEIKNPTRLSFEWTSGSCIILLSNHGYVAIVAVLLEVR